jgi:hypothetical protein
MASQQYIITVSKGAAPIKVDDLEQALHIAEILSREYGASVQISGTKSDFTMSWPSGGANEALRQKHGMVKEISQQSPADGAKVAAEALDAAAATYAPFPEKTGDLLGKNGLARVHFFDGRFLTAATLQAEQIYWDARTRIAAQIHPAGIARGLGLTYPLLDGGPGVDPGANVTLQPGLAFDGYGRPIVVGAAYPFKLRDLIERWVQTPVALSALGGTTFAPCLCVSPGGGAAGGGSSFPSGPYLLVIAASECPEGQAKVFGTACPSDTSDTCEIDRWRSGFGLSLVQLPDLISAHTPGDEWARRGLMASWYFDTYDVRQDRWRGNFPFGAFASDVVQATGNPITSGEAVPLAVVWVDSTQGVTFFDTWTARRHLISTHTAYAAHRVIGAPPPAAVQARLHQFQVMLEEVLAARGLGRSVTTIGGLGNDNLFTLGFRSIPPAGFLPMRRDDHRVHSATELPEVLADAHSRYAEGAGPSLLLTLAWQQAAAWFAGTNVLPLPVVALHDDDVLRLLREVEQRDPIHLAEHIREIDVSDEQMQQVLNLFSTQEEAAAEARRRRAAQEKVAREHLASVVKDGVELERRVRAMVSELESHDKLAAWHAKARPAEVASAASVVGTKRVPSLASSGKESLQRMRAMSASLASGKRLSTGQRINSEQHVSAQVGHGKEGAWKGFSRPVATSTDPDAKCVEVMLRSVLEALGGVSPNSWPLFSLVRDIIARRIEPVRLVVPMSSATRVHPVFGVTNAVLAAELAQAKASWNATLLSASPDDLGGYDGTRSFWSDNFEFEARPHDWVLYARESMSFPMLLPQLMEALGCCGCEGGLSCEDAARRMCDYIWVLHQSGVTQDGDDGDHDGMPQGYDPDPFGADTEFLLFPAYIQAVSLPDGCCDLLAACLHEQFGSLGTEGVGLSRDALQWLVTWLDNPGAFDLANYGLRAFGVMTAVVEEDFNRRSVWLLYAAFLFFARPDVLSCVIKWYLENGDPNEEETCWAARMFCRTLDDLIDTSMLMTPGQVDDMIADPDAAVVINLLKELLGLTPVDGCCDEMGECIADAFGTPMAPWSQARIATLGSIRSRLDAALAAGGGVLDQPTFTLLRDDLYAVFTDGWPVNEANWLLPFFTLAHQTGRVGLFVCALEQWDIPEIPAPTELCPEAGQLVSAITTLYGPLTPRSYSEFVTYTEQHNNQSLVASARQYIAMMSDPMHPGSCCTSFVTALGMTQFNPMLASVNTLGFGAVEYPSLVMRWWLHSMAGAIEISTAYEKDVDELLAASFVSPFNYVGPPQISVWVGGMAALVDGDLGAQRALLACVYKKWLAGIPGNCRGMIGVVEVLVAVPTTDSSWSLEQVNTWQNGLANYGNAVSAMMAVNDCCEDIAFLLGGAGLAPLPVGLTSGGLYFYGSIVKPLLENIESQASASNAELFTYLSPLRQLFNSASYMDVPFYPTWLDIFSRIARDAGRLHQFGCSLLALIEFTLLSPLTAIRPDRPIATAVVNAFEATPAALITNYNKDKERTISDLEAEVNVSGWKFAGRPSMLDANLNRRRRALAALVEDAERNPIVGTSEFAEVWAKGKGRLRDHDRVLEAVENFAVDLGEERAIRAVQTLRGIREHVPGDSYELVVNAFIGAGG